MASIGMFVNWEDIDERATDPDIAAAHRRLPNLASAEGPPLEISGTVGGNMVVDPDLDHRLVAMSKGFPVSIHPLRTPNTRAQLAAGESVVDFKFLRLAGLLAKMVPLRTGVDKVHLHTIDGAEIRRIYGRVRIVFDAAGFEFEHEFWVMDIGFPVEMQLGQSDFCSKFKCVLASQDGGMVIKEADAKKVRAIADVYVVQ